MNRSPEIPYPEELVELAGEQYGIDTDKPRHECGVFGIYAPDRNVAKLTTTAIHELQHRGDATAGIAVTIGDGIDVYSGRGTAGEVFDEDLITILRGDAAVGHCRFATTGEAYERHNEHPFKSPPGYPKSALSHNGNLTNRLDLLADIAKIDRNLSPNGSTDSEIGSLWMSVCPADTWKKRIQAFMTRAEGSYSMALLTPEGLYAFRDGSGNRPLNLGQIDGGWVVSSETGVFPIIDAHKVREVKPGEIIRIDQDGYQTVSHRPARRKAVCVFEFEYFSRGDSYLEGKYLDDVRREIGRQLALEDISRDEVPDVDVVSGVPHTGIPMAKGYSAETDIPYDDVLQTNRYSSMRTFIKPKTAREEVERKFNVLVNVVERYPRIALIDDSYVKFNTAPQVEKMLTKAGATEIHHRSGSPKIIRDCDYGVNMGREDELKARNRSLEEIRELVGGQSIAFLSPEKMLEAIGMEFGETCTECMTGAPALETKDHPTTVDELPEEFTAARYRGGAGT